MVQSDRPLRADAARNRARVLEVALEVFAADGLSVPIDEIARRAGVGAGTVYRHFPAKEDLLRAVVVDQFERVVEEGRELLGSGEPGDALFRFLRLMVLDWGATNRGIADALTDASIDVGEGEDAFTTLLTDLLRAAQQAGTARVDVDAGDIKALLVGCQAMRAYNPEALERRFQVVVDGLRRGSLPGGAPPGSDRP